MNSFTFILINIITFICCRYFFGIMIILNKTGPNFTYSFWDYVPPLLGQIMVLMYIYFKQKKRRFAVIITILILIGLFLGGHFDVLPNILAPT